MSDLIQEIKEILEKYEVKRPDGEWRTVNDAIEFTSAEWMKQLIYHLETAERQRDEAVKALEWYASTENYEIGNYTSMRGEIPTDWESKIQQEAGGLARTTLKRIKGSTQAEGHQSTE
ncbi:hypothetical protein D3C75_1067610 [compost metagenome]